MTGSAYMSVSRDKLNSNFDSVKEQSGLFAGRGGYDVKVGEHMQLNGAVIASSSAQDRNRLETGTLGWSDIHNQADYKATHSGGSFSSGGPVGKDLLTHMAGGMLSGANNSGHADGTTKAGVSEGTLIVRDSVRQRQDITTLNRDTEHANDGSISPIFNKEKEQNRLKQVQLIGEIGGQVMDIARTEGAIAATKAANEKMKSASPEDQSKAEAQWRKANPGKEPKAEDINKQVYQNFYNQAFNDSGFGTGGKVQQGMQAATAAIQGLAGGNLAAAIAGGAAPYIANVIAQSTDDPAARTLAHAAVNAAIAAAQGNNALAGAAGAAAGEIAAGIIKDQLYGKDTKISDLSEEQKQTISALATLAGGLAGGLTGDSSADAVAGGQAAKTTSENNYLSYDQAHAFDKEMTACKAAGGDCSGIIRKYDALNKRNRIEMQEQVANDPLTALAGQTKWDIEGGLSAADRPDWLYGSLDNDDVKNYVTGNNSYDLNYLNTHTSKGDKGLAFIGEPENVWGLVAGAGSLFTSSATIGNKVIGAGLSYGANGGVQLLNGNTGDKFDYLSFATSGFTGAGGVGKSLNSNLMLNVGNAYFTSQVSGQDSKSAMMGAAAGTGIGFGIGAGITSQMESRLIKDYFGMPASSNAIKYTESSFGPGFLFKGGEMSPVPGILGGTGGAISQEAISNAAQSNGDKK